MYARVVLGDLFLHGIGGGKYDELTDAIVGRFLGVAPPEFAVVTADAWQGRGVASALMKALIACARKKGLQRLVGTVLRANQNMIRRSVSRRSRCRRRRERALDGDRADARNGANPLPCDPLRQ